MRITQSESSECGLACVAMIAAARGLEVDLATLRRKFPVSLKGATLKQIISVADQLGFNARALRGEIADLTGVSLPAVLHWDLNHFVVLTAIKSSLKGTKYTILDPASGARTLTGAELSQHFTGVVLELTPSERFQRKTETVKLQFVQLWSRMTGLKRALAQIFGLSLLLQVFVLATPYYLQLAIDSALPSFDADLLLMLALGFGGIALFQTATGALRKWILLSLGTSFGAQIVVNLFRHMLRLPQGWFEKRHVGDIVSRFGSSQAVVDLLTQGMISAVIDGLMAITTLVLLFLYAPTLAWITVIAFGLFTAIKLASLPAMRLTNSNVIMAEAREQSIFMESVRGMQAIKLLAREGDQQRKWFNRYAALMNARLKMGQLTIGFDSAGQFIVAISNIIIIYLAVRYAMTGLMSVGMIFAFQAYRGQFTGSAQSLIDQLISYKMLAVHMARIADIALNPPEMMNDASGESGVPLAGLIELKSVSFKFAPHEPDVLNEVTIRIQPGETIAIIGPSGGGKTTLLKLVLGLLEPSAGEVCIDGQSLTRINKRSYRRQIGAVMQDDVLFAGSIAENIAFFDTDIDMARVHDAARTASIHDEISAMTMGYESLVGDMGSALSGGQKQRVLLARALYHQPRLLVLDEGTAHLDIATEAKVSAAIAGLNITRIIVAHRPETIRTANRVLLLENGIIREIYPDKLAIAAA